MVMSSVTELPRQTQSSRLPSALAVKDTKQTTEAAHVCVWLRVSFLRAGAVTYGQPWRGERWEGFIGEGDGESVRIAWWRTDPAVMAAYKLSYYIMRPGQ